MAIPPSVETCVSDVCEPAAVLRDEVAEHRVRRVQAERLRLRHSRAELAGPEREDYELPLDAHEGELAGGRGRLGGEAGLLRGAPRLAHPRRGSGTLPPPRH